MSALRRPPLWRMSLVLTVVLLAPAATLQADPGRSFPYLALETLDGERMALGTPKTSPCLVVATYVREHDDLSAWTRTAKRLQRTQGLCWLSVPVVDEVPSWVRTMIKSGMKVMLDDDIQARTAPLWADNKAAMMRAMGARDREAIDVMVVGCQGAVVWRDRGAPHAEMLRALQKAVKAATQQTCVPR